MMAPKVMADEVAAAVLQAMERWNASAVEATVLVPETYRPALAFLQQAIEMGLHVHCDPWCEGIAVLPPGWSCAPKS